MTTKALILAEIKKKGQIKSSDLTQKTGFSRTYINRLLDELEHEGQIVSLGKTRSTVYVLADSQSIKRARQNIKSFKNKYANSGLSEELVFLEIDKTTGIFADLNANVRNILHFAFTEMLNNAIEHSRSNDIVVKAQRNETGVTFTIIDWGIGVFESIKKKFNLPDNFSAIELLLKGKQTTDPARHTGQGIFFTSKMADAFTLQSGKKSLQFIKKINDYFIHDNTLNIGTTVHFRINIDSQTDAVKIFAEYTNSEFEFDKTKVTVKLYKNKDGLVSRSEARRIVFGLEKFETIVLDFKDVEAVGQGFADEIFRVWQNQYPDKTIRYVNTNKNVEAMIKMAR